MNTRDNFPSQRWSLALSSHGHYNLYYVMHQVINSQLHTLDKKKESTVKVFALSMIFRTEHIVCLVPSALWDIYTTGFVYNVISTKVRTSEYQNKPFLKSTKIFESIFLNKYSTLLETSHNQFGFKNKSSKDLCAFTSIYLHKSFQFYICVFSWCQ